MNYMVKPKVFLSVSTALHCIAAHFFFFAALKSRCLDFTFPTIKNVDISPSQTFLCSPNHNEQHKGMFALQQAFRYKEAMSERA